MATVASTTTAIQLEELGGASRVTQRDVAGGRSDAASADSALDPVLQASRLADSSVPDGGYGWVVIFACAVLAWWFVGTSYSWGVLQGALVRQGVASAAVLSFVGSSSMGLMSLLALANSRLIRSLGARYTGMLGVSLLGVSGIASSFATGNVGALFFTEGVLMGCGMSLCFMVVSATPAQYFSKKRGIANGIVFAGGGLGGAVISYSLGAIVERLGVEWAFRIIGLLTLATGLPAAWLLKERAPIRKGAFVEWRLFKRPDFILIFLAGAIATFPLLVPAFFIPLYAYSIGLSASTGAGLLAGFNFSSAVGRIICGFLCDSIGPLNALFISLTLSALSMLALWPESTTLAPLAAFVIINGMGNGGFFSTIPTVVGNVFGSARVSVAMGMVVTSWLGGYLLGSPIAGFLLDAYGGQDGGFQAYRPAMYYAGSLALASAFLIQIVRFRLNRNPFAKL